VFQVQQIAPAGLYHRKFHEGVCLLKCCRCVSTTAPPNPQLNAVPIVHGSALVETGETQCLATATVGGKDEVQRSTTLVGADSKRLICHHTLPSHARNQV
jgi:polyribonucleotide nucleotidyltransferase